MAVEFRPQRRQVALRDMRQHQVLLVADADFAERIAVGEIGDRVHLRGGGVARRAAFGFERDRHDGVAGNLVIENAIAHPGVEAAVGAARLVELGRIIVEPLVGRIAEAAGDVGDRGGIERERTVLDAPPFRFDFRGERLGPELVHQNLDARLVNVVAAAELVIGAQYRLDVA